MRHLTLGLQTNFLLLTFTCLAFSGCGGGGGGATISPPPESCVSTTEGCLTTAQYTVRVNHLKQNYQNNDAGFSNQWGLNTINADAAWAKIQLKHGTNTAPGTGITLGIIDDDIDTGHPVFAGKTVTEIFLLGATDEDGSSTSHGTSVASVMVGSPSQSFISQTTGARGVAWGADITMFAIPAGTSGGSFEPTTLASLNYWNDATRFPAVVNRATGWSSGGRSLDFVNVSLAFQAIIDMYSKSDLTTNFGNIVSALAQSGSSSKTVFVWAAGNAHGNSCDVTDFPTNHQNLCVSGKVVAVSPSIPAGLTARFPELRGNNIAVVAIDSTGSIASFSNRCGIAADWCIAAPGDDVRIGFFGPVNMQNARRGSGNVDGTSVAAPFVTGGLAVMKHFFRNQLSNTALVRRLYATANKSGIYATKSIYGQGLMDLDAAVSPRGFTFVTLGNQVKEGGIPLDTTSLNLGPAFGDGLTHSFANQEIAAFDELGAPFWYSLGGLTGTRPGPSIQSRLTNFMNLANNDHESGIFRPILGALPTEQRIQNSGQLSLGLMDTSNLVDDGGHLSLLGRAIVLNRPVSEKLDISLFSTEGDASQAKAAGLEFVLQSPVPPPFKPSMVFRSGVVAEPQSLLRSSASGAFGRISGQSIFMGLEGNLRVGLWDLSAGAEIGNVAADIDESLLSVKSPLTTSTFALRAGKKLNERDTLSFSLSQPLRIESGRAEYTIPVGRTTEGDVLKVSDSVDLEPSGRQIDFGAQWHRSLPVSNGDFRLATGLSFHPGHSGGAKPEIIVLAGLRLGF